VAHGRRGIRYLHDIEGALREVYRPVCDEQACLLGDDLLEEIVGIEAIAS
jgi:hypothetical protein